MPKRRLDFDDDQYTELEDLYFALDTFLLQHEDDEYRDRDEYVNLLHDARDYLQGLVEEVDYVVDGTQD